MPKSRTLALLALTGSAALALPAAASAHVTVSPREVAARSFSVLTVRLPNERANKGTTKVDVRLPAGVYSLSYKRCLAGRSRWASASSPSPVDLGEFSVSERYTRVVFTAKKSGIIRPGQFEEFPLSVRVPDGDAGDVLAFPAVQTYQGGEKVRWTGPADAELPALRLMLLAAAGDE